MSLRTQIKMLLLLAATAMALSLAACGDEETTKTEGAIDTAQAVSVFSTKVRRQNLVTPVTGTGTIAAQKTTDAGPLVDGIIEQVFVSVGDRVKEGDPLFKTRDIEFRLRVQELESQHRLAEAEARNARRDLDRIKELHAKGVASVGQLDNVQTGYEIAAAKLGVARARLDSARQNLKDTTVRAPFDGVVTRQNVYEGKFMTTRGGSMSGPSGVVQIMKIDIVGAIINVPERHIGEIDLGTKARVYVDGIGGVYDGEINIFNDRVDPNTRSAEVRVAILNDDYRIKPGMFTRAEFFPAPRSTLTLDRTAVQGIEGNQYVFIRDANGNAKRMPVHVAQIDAARVEITDGLLEGTDVLTGPLISTLVDGMPVAIEPLEAPPLPSAQAPLAPPSSRTE